MQTQTRLNSILRRILARGTGAALRRLALPALLCFGCTAVSALENSTNHWAFRTLQSSTPPPAQSRERVRTPIDAYVLAKLDENQMHFAPDADKMTVLRRLYLDLIGLPPPIEAIESLQSADPEESFSATLDSLLHSPHFGERWGRHWLDWAGYVDVLGGDNDAGNAKVGEGKWRYRDYVIRAFNDDKPFDRFLLEQLAGDKLVDWKNAPQYTDEIRDLLTATGFLRCASDDTDEQELNTPDVHQDILQRTGELVANNLLALTVQCAKCHDHKYEPISQRDYYRFLGVFNTAFNSDHWLQPKERAIPDVSASEKAAIERHNAPYDKQITALKENQADIRKPYHERLLDEKLEKLPESIRSDTRIAIATSADKRSEVQKYLVEKLEKELSIKPSEIDAILSQTDKSRLADLDREIAQISANRRTWGTIQAVYDTGPAPDLHILVRGERPGEKVEPGFFTALGGGAAGASTSGSESNSMRRLQLARWLTAPDSPPSALVARVFVNRVWQQLFGKGLVETSDNFGLSGAKPSHPELLDWLAAEFIRNGWQLKPLLRLITSSTVYRQSAQQFGNETAVRIDPDNQWLWRQRLRRLESEVIRDSILSVSGQLVTKLGGAPLLLENRPDGLVVIKEKVLKDPAQKNRRSLYLLARRNYHLSLLTTFDQPAVSINCTRRIPSAVVSQPLTMLNDSFVLEQSQLFADRIIKQIPDRKTRVERIKHAFMLALTRAPTADELQSSLELVSAQTERRISESDTPDIAERNAFAHLCHVLFNTSEFLYVP